jgi:hypothetical protein
MKEKTQDTHRDNKPAVTTFIADWLLRKVKEPRPGRRIRDVTSGGGTSAAGARS